MRQALRTAEESREMAVSALEKQEQNRQKQIQIREACEELDVSPPARLCVGVCRRPRCLWWHSA